MHIKRQYKDGSGPYLVGIGYIGKQSALTMVKFKNHVTSFNLKSPDFTVLGHLASILVDA